MLSLFEHGFRPATFRIDDIERIDNPQRNKDNVESRVVTLRDGTTFTAMEPQIERIFQRPVQLSPAAPGISMVRVYIGDGTPAEVNREPVIAWALCVDGEIRAVTPNGVSGGSASLYADVFVEMPDGDVQAVGEWGDRAGYDSVEAMVADLEAKARPRSEPSAEEPAA